MTRGLPSAAQQAQLEQVLQSEIIGYAPVAGGHSEAGRWFLSLANGGSAFLKVGVDEPTKDGLALEAFTYELLGPTFVPSLLAYVDLEFGCLAIEDLSDAIWPPPWHEQQIDNTFALLDRLADVTVPADHMLGRLRDRRHLLLGWERVVHERADFLGLGLRSERWLDDRLALLTKLEQHAQLDGAHLVHRDLRSDNICFIGADCRFVDWAGTEIGNHRFDAVSLMISIRADAPQANVSQHVQEGDLELVALQTGFLASRAGRPDPYPGSFVRRMQRAQLAGALALLEELL